jgi:transposase-like protein
MLNESEKERIRRAVLLEKKSINRVAQEEGYSRQTVEKVLSLTPPQPNPLPRSRPSPVFGPYQQRADALLRQNEQMPRKQRYTAHRIFEILQEEGY